MWRIALTTLMLLTALATAPVAAQDQASPADLAAMVVPPSGLPEPGFQFARGGYLTTDDARYLLQRQFGMDDDGADSLVNAVSWNQGYTGTYSLLSDRSYRTSEPIESVTAIILEFSSSDGATGAEALLSGTPLADAEPIEPAVDGGASWRMVTSQDDMLVTVARADRFVVVLVTAGRQRTPDTADHAAVVGATIMRVEQSTGTGLSRQFVLIDDDGLIPVAVATEDPLAHTWYRLLDDEVVPAAGELDAPAPDDIAPGVEEIAVSRQTAELSSQNWVTAGIVTARFDSDADATAFQGVIRDPLDFFPESEAASGIDPGTGGIAIEAISGESRVGGGYSGYRATVVEGEMLAQLTIRSTGSTVLDQASVERWAELQRQCLGNGPCDAVPLVSLLQTPDPSEVAEAELDAGSYRSPVAPWAVTFDTDVWTVTDTFAEGGYDYLYLRSQWLDATFETIVDHHGDPERCVLGELDRLREAEEHAVIEVGSDDPNESPGGLTSGHGWVVYTVEPLEEARADQEYVIRIDCYTVVEGSTSLVVQTRAPRDLWSDVAAEGEALRVQIEIDGVSASEESGDPLAMFPGVRSDTMINRRPWVGAAA